MKAYRFRIVNVFAEAPLAGNALCVFEDGSDLDTATMQALALQFNLSETTFILPSTKASARVRIFTPTFEMPFAGHPTLGSAQVVRELRNAGPNVTLEMQVGVVPVAADGAVWTFTAKAPQHQPPTASDAELAAMLGIAVAEIDAAPLMVDTGSRQLLVPLRSFDAVRRANPSAASLNACAGDGTRALAYVFAREGNAVLARFFFSKFDSVIEDPGTGSACANLGGWLLATGATLPQKLTVDQGADVGRPCRLGLEVTADRRILVSGRVIELGSGSIHLPA